MNEGLGTTPIVVIIVVFIAVASSYLAYNVNYMKAFRMKNKIIAIYEKYDGFCDGDCQTEIIQYGKTIGYSSVLMDCQNNPLRPRTSIAETVYKDPGYCVYKIEEDMTEVADAVEDTTLKRGYYYRIVTRINIQIPIVQNVMGLSFLNVSGDTRQFNRN